MDPLVNALNTIMTHEERRKKECIITPASGLVSRVLRHIQSKGYIGEIEFIDDGRQGFSTMLPSVYSRSSRKPSTRARTSTCCELAVMPTNSKVTGESFASTLITVTSGNAGGGASGLPQAASRTERTTDKTKCSEYCQHTRQTRGG